MDIIEQIKQEAKYLLEEAKGHHDWDHTERVYNLAVHIAEKENADLLIVKLAALLHDVGRQQEFETKGKICHAEIGAILAGEILKKHGLEENKIKQVVHCIISHRYRNNIIPETKEAKCLFDADKLDSIGAIGIGRAFLFAGEIHAKLHNHKIDVTQTENYSKDDTAYREFVVKLRDVKDKVYTEEGKRIAIERDKFMTGFFDRLSKEVDGEL